MTVYISGRIRGEKDYKEKFARAEKTLEKNGFMVVNPARMNYSGLSREQMLEIDLEFLKLCDYIYMLNGWEESCGACMEYGYARAAGKKVYFEEDEEEG